MNTDYLFSMTEDDADREQELLYRSQLQEVDLNYLVAYSLYLTRILQLDNEEAK